MYKVVITPEAREELKELRDWIASKNMKRIAARYISRLKAFCRELGISPHRGEARDGVQFGQRTIGFERRVSVIFEVRQDIRTVNIAGIRYGGRSLEQK